MPFARHTVKATKPGHGQSDRRAIPEQGCRANFRWKTAEGGLLEIVRPRASRVPDELRGA